MANPKIQVDITADAKGLKKGAKEAGDAVEKLADEADKSGGKFRNKLGGFVDGVGGKLSGFGDQVRNLARDRLGVLGDAADAVGFDLEKMNGKMLAAGAGLAAVGAFAAQGVSKFTALAGEVRKVHDAAGLSFDSSSRLVAVSDDLGISADTVAASMGRLAKNIDAGKLKDFNIEVANANDGTVDVAETLGNVADAMNRTIDPAKRAAMGTQLFGKSWADLAPVLQLGRSGIRDAFAAVSDGQIVTKESADAARAWEMALDDAGDAISELQMELAQKLLPSMTEGVSAFTKFVAWANDTEEALVNLGKVNREVHHQTALTGSAIGDAALKMADLALAAGPAAKQTEALEAAERGAEKAARDQARETANTARTLKDLEKALDDAVAAQDRAKASVVTAFESQNRYEQAQRETAEALANTSTASAALTDATNVYGAESAEATEAQAAFSQSLQDAEAKVYAQAQAAVDLAQKHADVSGATLNTADANQIYRDKLVEARDATADPTLRQALDDRITQFDSLSVNANNTATGVAEANTKLAEAKTAVGDSVLQAALDTAASKFGNLASAAWQAADGMAAAALRAASMPSTPMPVSQTSGDPASVGRATGGMTMADVPYRVGESGTEVFIPQRNGRVLSVPQAQQALAGAMGAGGSPGGGGGAPLVVQVVVDGRQFAESAIPHLEVHRRSTQ